MWETFEVTLSNRERSICWLVLCDFSRGDIEVQFRIAVFYTAIR